MVDYNPYGSLVLAAIATGVVMTAGSEYNFGGANSADMTDAMLNESEFPLPVVNREPYLPSKYGNFTIDVETDWNSECSYRLDSGANLNRILTRQGIIADVPPEHAWNKAYPGYVDIQVLQTTATTDGMNNPATEYMGDLSRKCDGVELNHPEQRGYKGLGVSGHEFGTVEFLDHGEVHTYYSAYSVPGFVITVTGVNIPLDQVRALSSAQSEKVFTSPNLIPSRGMATPGLVETVEKFTGSA